MADKQENRGRNRQGLSLQRRAQLIFLIYIVVSFALIMVISIRAFTSGRAGGMLEMATRDVRQASAYVEATIKDITYISQQMSYQGTIGPQLYIFRTQKDSYTRMSAMEQIDSYIRLIAFTNPKIGLVLYYDAKSGLPVFSNMEQKQASINFDNPVLYEVNDLVYYGPHVSQSRFSMDNVLSLVRKVELFGIDDIYVYIEESLDLQDYRAASSDSLVNYFMILNPEGIVNYSQLDRYIPGEVFDTGGAQTGIDSGYQWFSAKSDSGWETVMFVPDGEFFAARNEWLQQIAAAALVALVLALLLPSFVWQIFYRPVRSLDREIRMMDSELEKVVSTGIPEADKLLNQTLHMKGQLLELIEDIRIQEQRRADMEIEKLVYQINPHFLMNTINTVHWLAVENNQHEIDQVAISLNKLLHYNLGKDGSTNLRKEINIIQEYIAIQLNRYSFTFCLNVGVPSRVLDTPVPRFILQPLCENAISHGIDDGGTLTVELSMPEDEKTVVVLVKDDGKGIPENYDIAHGVGMGIGIGYVRGMLQSFYGQRASIQIDSVQGQGTEIRLFLPIV